MGVVNATVSVGRRSAARKNVPNEKDVGVIVIFADGGKNANESRIQVLRVRFYEDGRRVGEKMSVIR